MRVCFPWVVCYDFFMDKFLIHIHGGESFLKQEEYEAYLSQLAVDIPDKQQVNSKRWKDLYEEKFPEFMVIKPKMPCADNAKYKYWELILKKYIALISGELFLVGHSLGGIFLLEFLSKNVLPKDVVLKQLHIVSSPLQAGDFKVPENLENVGSQAEQVFIYHSKDDQIVAFSDGLLISKKMPHSKFLEFENRGHFIGEGNEDFPELFENIKGN